MKLITKLLLVAFLATSFMATAQDEEEEDSKPELSISGSVDAYFRTNLNSANDGTGSAPGSSFANQNGFALGMANVVIGMDGEKAGFVADLVYGPRGDDAVFASPYSDNGSSNIVNQLYAYWNISDAATITMGNFNTFLGYEVISPAANFNYSTSYMFSYGPFSHTGLKVDIAASDDLSFMVGVFNPTDLTEYNPTSKYSIGAQVGYKGVYLNLLYGDQAGNTPGVGDLFQVDLTAGFDLSDAFYLGLNATYNNTAIDQAEIDPAFGVTDDNLGFLGAAAYLQYSLSDAFALGTRVEYFSEKGAFGAIGTGMSDTNVIDVTLTGQYKVGDLTVIPEIRFDAASENAFTDKDGAASKSLASFVLAAVYAF